jgi:hypothetical protein
MIKISKIMSTRKIEQVMDYFRQQTIRSDPSMVLRATRM